MRISSLLRFSKIQKGFTLVEALVASVIVVLLISFFLDALNQSLTLAESLHSQDIALNAAQAKLEEISHSGSNLLTYNGQSFTVAGLTASSGWANPGSVTVALVSGTTNLYNITANVTWRQRNSRVLSCTLSTNIALK
jgi:prepilin-type N-terminal cleavage/methylation domain-containing protein